MLRRCTWLARWMRVRPCKSLLSCVCVPAPMAALPPSWAADPPHAPPLPGRTGQICSATGATEASWSMSRRKRFLTAFASSASARSVPVLNSLEAPGKLKHGNVSTLCKCKQKGRGPGIFIAQCPLRPFFVCCLLNCFRVRTSSSPSFAPCLAPPALFLQRTEKRG